MKPFNHTPGPYRLVDGAFSSRAIETLPDEKGRTRVIANVRSAGLTDEEVRANVALLSASARMHAVLWAIRGSNAAMALLDQTPMPDGESSIWKALNVALIEASTGIPVEQKETAQ